MVSADVSVMWWAWTVKEVSLRAGWTESRRWAGLQTGGVVSTQLKKNEVTSSISEDRISIADIDSRLYFRSSAGDGAGTLPTAKSIISAKILGRKLMTKHRLESFGVVSAKGE